MVHETLGQQRYKNPAFPRCDARKSRDHFVVNHYAGKVMYNCNGWIVKNMDSMSLNLKQLCTSECGDLVTELFSKSERGVTQTTKRGTRKKFQGLGDRFMKQINTLCTQIDQTRVHFIRTIKTNALMKPGRYEPDYVISQLTCSGMFACCELLKAGYPTRIDFGELAARFRPMMPDSINAMGLSDRLYVSAIVWAYGIPKCTYQCGLNKIFFRAGKVAMMDEMEKGIAPEQHDHLVARVKRWVIRRQWRYAAAKAIAFERALQSYRRVHAAHTFRWAVRVHVVYGKTLRYRLGKVREAAAARKIQSLARMVPARKAYLKATAVRRQNRAALKIQRVARGHAARKQFAEFTRGRAEKKAAVMLQALARGFAARKAFAEKFGAQKEERAAMAIQTLARQRAAKRQAAAMRAELDPAAFMVQRMWGMIGGETGVRFKSIVTRMVEQRRDFYARMDELTSKYAPPPAVAASSASAGEVDPILAAIRARKAVGKFKSSSASAGLKGFEMWVSLSVQTSESKFGNPKKAEVFAATSTKLSRCKGYFKGRFGDASNASNDMNEEGNYIINRDPTFFAHIMDFIRDGSPTYPMMGVQSADGKGVTEAVDPVALEALLEEADHYAMEGLVLPLVEKLKEIKFTNVVRYAPGFKG